MAKTIVITGAGTGLGRVLARRLAGDGDRVVLLGRSLAKLQAVVDEVGAPAMAIGCDVGDADSVRSAFATIADRCGHIDVLVNNAAIFQPFTIEEASDAQVRAAVDTNLLGPIWCARAAIPLLRASAAGLIVSISSESVELDIPHLVIYETTKAGLERLMRGLRQELRSDGIRATTLRIGSLIDPDKQWDVDPQAFERFMRAAADAGLPLTQPRFSRLETIAGIIRTMIDLPRDTGLDLVALSGHAAP